jgi:diguanylate cyclase
MSITISLLGLLVVALVTAVAVLLRRQARLLEEKRSSDSRYRTIVEQAGDGILLVDAASGRIIEANYSARCVLGYSTEEIARLQLTDVLIEQPRELEAAGGQFTTTRSRPIAIKQRHKDGKLTDVEVTVSSLDMEGRPTLCYIAHDVTERKRVELELLRDQQRLDHLAHHDSLTGLPNRLLLRGHLEQRLSSSGAREPFAVLLLDLDDFKRINDSYGHTAGDELLIETARRLKTMVGAGGMVARLGGDEFVVVLDQVEESTKAMHLADGIVSTLTAPMRIAGRTVTTSASIGISLCPYDANDVESALRHADLAMYTAKQAGRNNVQLFDVEMGERQRQRVRFGS